MSELQGIALSGSARSLTHSERAKRIGVSGLGWVFPLYAVLVLAVGWAYALLRIESDRAQTLESERSRLRVVTATMQTGIQAMLNDGLGSATAAAYASTDAERSAALTQSLASRQYVRSLFLWSAGRYLRVGRGGVVEAGTKAPDWLWTPGSTASGTHWVGRTLRNPEHTSEFVIPIARYLALPGGGVWAGGLFEFGAFDEMYARLGQNPGVLALISSDGTILFRIPSLPAYDLTRGVSVAQNPLFKQAIDHPEVGVAEGASPLQNIPMLFGYERVYGYELLVVAGRARDAVLAPWRERRRTTLWATGVSSALVTLLTVLVGYYLSARRNAERTLTERSSCRAI